MTRREAYGTTYAGGSAGMGTVFSLKTGGGDYAGQHSFAGRPSDGASPFAGLAAASDGQLYGTTRIGGTANIGTVTSLAPPPTGDINGDGTLNVSDVFYLINDLFAGGPPAV